MGSFRIRNGARRTYSCNQNHFFHYFTSRDVKRTGHKNVKIAVCVLANFSKTAEKNKTPFTGIQAGLKLSSNQQTDRKSVHSTRSYSNIKVPYVPNDQNDPFRVLFRVININCYK